MEQEMNMTTEMITIAGQAFRVPMPFEEGHVCTKGEADALNQVLHEAIRAKFKSLVEREFSAQVTSEVDQAQRFKKIEGLIMEFTGRHRFGARGGGGLRDPVQALAQELALRSIKEQIRAEGRTVKEFGTAKLNEAVEKLLAGEKGQRFIDIAKAMRQAQQLAAKDALEEVKSSVAGGSEPA